MEKIFCQVNCSASLSVKRAFSAVTKIRVKIQNSDPKSFYIIQYDNIIPFEFLFNYQNDNVQNYSIGIQINNNAPPMLDYDYYDENVLIPSLFFHAQSFQQSNCNYKYLLSERITWR